MRPIDLIVIHCSDTPDAMDSGAAEIRGWRLTDNGWSDIGRPVSIRRHAIRRDAGSRRGGRSGNQRPCARA